MLRLSCLAAALLSSAAAFAQTPGSSPYDSARFTLFRPVPRNQLRELRPDRPGVTESPFTVDAGHFQLETDALRLINRRAQDQREREWHVAYSTLKLGLSRRTDVQAEFPLLSVQQRRRAADPNWERRRGFGDLALRLKHNFLGDDQERPLALAIIGYVQLPTGGAAGSGGPEAGLILPVDIGVAERWDVEGQLETDLHYDRETGRHYLGVVPSFAVEHEFNDKVGLLVEAVSRWAANRNGWLSSVNVAPTYNLTSNLQLDFGAHLALNRETDREFFFGFTYRR